MKFINRLERSIGRFAIPRITIYLIFLQSFAFMLTMGANARNAGHGDEFLFNLLLIGGRVLHGEAWRIFTFIAVPPPLNAIFFFFAMYLLFFVGTALENHWGTFRYNVFLLVGWLATVLVALALPTYPASNRFLMQSIFLAFAFLYPEFEILLFFIIPVKVKWLALLTWIVYLYQFTTGGWLDKCLILAAIANFLLCFHRDLWQRAGAGHRRMLLRAQNVKPVDDAFNRCTICGVTEKTDRKMEFRYCPQCAGTPCYCINHINNHQHLAKVLPVN